MTVTERGIALSETPVLSVSVVIPAYNRAATILPCLQSVLRQTVSPLEVIVVDDCSTDRTAEVVGSLSDFRVRCLVQPKNAGAQAARNRGIREAKGEWIAFQDSDDEWLPEKMEKQIAALAAVKFDPWTVVHGNAIWRDCSSGRTLAVEIPLVEGEESYAQVLSYPAPLFPTILASKVALEKIGYLDENVKTYQEWDTSIRLAKYCRFFYLRDPLFIYNLHEGETISKNKNKDVDGYDFIISKHRDEIISVCGREAMDRHYRNLAERCLNYGMWEKADGYLSMVASPSLRSLALQVCRALRLPPRRLKKVKDVISPAKGEQYG